MKRFTSIIGSLVLSVLWSSVSVGDGLVSSYRIEVNLPAYKLTLYSGNEIIRNYAITIGSPQFKTPTGKHLISQVVINPWWFPPKGSKWAEGKEITPPGPGNPLGVVKMLLADGILLHGTGNPDGVGKALSHGCIRLQNEAIMELASLIIGEDAFALVRQGKTMGFEINPPVPVLVRYKVIEMEPARIFVHEDVYGKEKGRKIEEALRQEGVENGFTGPGEIYTGQFRPQDMRLLYRATL